MTNTIIATLGALNAVIVLWVLYLASMNIFANRASIKPVILWLAAGVVIAALVVDVLVNITIGTILFLEWPREWLLSQRLKRYHMQAFNWRFTIAAWICENLLNPFDPNKSHC